MKPSGGRRRTRRAGVRSLVGDAGLDGAGPAESSEGERKCPFESRRRAMAAATVTPRSRVVFAALMALLSLVLLAVANPAVAQPAGGVRGTIIDADFDVPLARVRVTIVELQRSTVSADGGSFTIEGVPPGRYTLTFVKDGYDREILRDVVVAPGRFAELRVPMISEVYELEELVVTGEDLLASSEFGLLEIRATAIGVQDAISSELISKAGVSDVAGALKLVVGASVVEGKYATVRGLSDRYTGTTLNGIRVPSADPRRRAVQIDLFPTGTIDSVTVTKTFTPDLQGDFTGGGVDIKTKSIPDEKILKIGASVEYNDQATGSDEFLTYRGGGVPALGVDFDRSRDLPAKPPGGGPPSRPSFRPTEADVKLAEEWDTFTRSFDPAMGTINETPGPNHGFSLVAGNRYERPDGRRFGILGAFTYSRKYDLYTEGIDNIVTISLPSDPVVPQFERSDAEGKDEVLVGGLLTLVLQPNERNEFSFKTVLNQSAEDTARFQEFFADGKFDQNQSLAYTERTVASGQLAGSHTFENFFEGPTFDNVELDWTVAYNYTRQNEPDIRLFRNALSELNGEYIADFDVFGGGSSEIEVTRRIFRIIEETDLQWKLDAEIPFVTGNDREGRFKTGAFFERNRRRFSRRVFTYDIGFQFGNNEVVDRNRSYLRGQLGSNRDALWSDVFTEPERIGLSRDRCPLPYNAFNGPRILGFPCANPDQLLWTLRPDPSLTIDYSGDQLIDAAYAMVDLPFWNKFRLIAGARIERTELEITPKNPDGGTLEFIVPIGTGGDLGVADVNPEELVAQVTDTSVLPSIGLTYEILPEMKLRASWSRTIARPTFREIAPVATTELLFGDEFFGNPNIQLSSIENWDLRWEWFRRLGEVLAFSVFRKTIEDPIEFVNLIANNRSFIQPVNYVEGKVEGFEVEARLPLDVVWDKLADFTIGANYTKLDSEVEVPASERERFPEGVDLVRETRRLQGQPEFVMNINATYDNEDSGTSVGVFYNVVGDTLLAGAGVGIDGAVPTTFEVESESLNISLSQAISDHLKLSLKAKNVTGDAKETIYRAPSGDQTINQFQPGATRYSVSASWTW